MALKPTDWDGGCFGPNADYPYGAILDGTTRVNFKSRNDILMFAQKMMDEAGINPNSIPDNDTNGYQIFEALQNLIGVWKSAGTPTVIAPSGSVSIGSGNVIVNKYVLQNRVVTWQVALMNFTITGTPASIGMQLPPDIIAAAKKFQALVGFVGYTNGSVPVTVVTGGAYPGPNDDYISIQKMDDTAFAAGTGNRVLFFTIITELLDR